jgi:alkylated DNA repair protein (DNA oxidative demethylase)
MADESLALPGFELPRREELGPDAVLLRGFALPTATAVWSAVTEVLQLSPFRHMRTPQGFEMSVAMTNCGRLGWVSDRKGYRYETRDPVTGRHWPAMPHALVQLAHAASASAGFGAFQPDACLINRYVAGARLSLHQDKDERDFTRPIVSVSLGLPAVFLWGGKARSTTTRKVPLQHGDVVAFGGTSRLHYHGVQPLKDGMHALLGRCRVNLTFRAAG